MQDESSQHAGVRVVVRAAPDVDLDELEAWVRSVGPVTVEVDAMLAAPATHLVRDRAHRCRPDTSGLDALDTLVGAT